MKVQVTNQNYAYISFWQVLFTHFKNVYKAHNKFLEWLKITY